LVVFERMAQIMAGTSTDDLLAQSWVEPIVFASLNSPDAWFAKYRRSKETIDYFTQHYESRRNALRRSLFRCGSRMIPGGAL
jgi:hypothetical protein